MMCQQQLAFESRIYFFLTSQNNLYLGNAIDPSVLLPGLVKHPPQAPAKRYPHWVFEAKGNLNEWP